MGYPKRAPRSGEEDIDCARREIEEECGIIPGELLDTFKASYHVYPIEDHYCFKKTSWFMFGYNGTLDTKPQLEEGITKAEWVKPENIQQIALSSWPSLSEIFNKVML